MKVDYQRNLHKCDSCRKMIKKWEVNKLVKIKYEPGPGFDEVSSDIKTKSKTLIELCPDCMKMFEDTFDTIIGRKKEE